MWYRLYVIIPAQMKFNLKIKQYGLWSNGMVGKALIKELEGKCKKIYLHQKN